MSKLASFVTGFGTGMAMRNEYEDRKRRREREDRMDKRDEERYQREETYRKDLEAAGQVIANGTSAVGGVRVGSQQDAQLAAQNRFAEAGGDGGNKPVQGGFGIMRNAALRHGRVADAASFGAMERQDNEAQRDKEWRDGRMKLMQEFQKTDKSRAAALNFYRTVGQHDFQYGKAQLGDLATLDDRADKMAKEGLFDAFQYYQATGDLGGTLDRFDSVGEKKIDRSTVQVQMVDDKITGQKTPVMTGKYQDGNQFRFDPEQLAHQIGGWQAYQASRKQVIDANDKAADNKREDEKLAVTKQHYERSDAADMVRARNSGFGAGGMGGSPKAVATMEWKAKAYKGIGIEENLSNAIAANPAFATTPKAVQQQAQFLMKTNVDALGRPKITPEQAMDMARQSMAAAQQISVDTMRDGGGQQVKPQGSPAYQKYKQARDKAYAEGDMDGVRAMDKKAKELGLIK